MKKIRIYPDKVLREKTKEINLVDKDIIKEMENLAKMLAEDNNAVGLAAPQIGISKKFFGIKDENKKVTVYINPVIKKTLGVKEFPKIVREKDSLKGVLKETEDFLEGCLSFPGFFGTVKRFLEIEINWKEIEEKKLVSKTGKLSGFPAIVFQHELDHLNGVLLIDKIKEDKGKFYKVVDQKMVAWDINKI